jgi:hypothetical protein
MASLKERYETRQVENLKIKLTRIDEVLLERAEYNLILEKMDPKQQDQIEKIVDKYEAIDFAGKGFPKFDKLIDNIVDMANSISVGDKSDVSTWQKIKGFFGGKSPIENLMSSVESIETTFKTLGRILNTNFKKEFLKGNSDKSVNQIFNIESKKSSDGDQKSKEGTESGAEKKDEIKIAPDTVVDKNSPIGKEVSKLSGEESQSFLNVIKDTISSGDISDFKDLEIATPQVMSQMNDILKDKKSGEGAAKKESAASKTPELSTKIQNVKKRLGDKDFDRVVQLLKKFQSGQNLSKDETAEGQSIFDNKNVTQDDLNALGDYASSQKNIKTYNPSKKITTTDRTAQIKKAQEDEETYNKQVKSNKAKGLDANPQAIQSSFRRDGSVIKEASDFDPKKLENIKKAFKKSFEDIKLGKKKIPVDDLVEEFLNAPIKNFATIFSQVTQNATPAPAGGEAAPAKGEEGAPAKGGGGGGTAAPGKTDGAQAGGAGAAPAPGKAGGAAPSKGEAGAPAKGGEAAPGKEAAAGGTGGEAAPGKTGGTQAGAGAPAKGGEAAPGKEAEAAAAKIKIKKDAVAKALRDAKMDEQNVERAIAALEKAELVESRKRRLTSFR